MKRTLAKLLAVAMVTQCLAEEGWNLYWEDDFERLDFNNWQHEMNTWGGGNYEFQAYTNDVDNTYVRDGVLYLKPTLTADKYGPHVFENGTMNVFDYGFCSNGDNWGCHREGRDIPPVMSGRIRSFQRFDFKYGKAVIEAKMPAGDWLWPAMWLLPEDWVYGGWPMSGEIDIVEIIGNRDLKSAGGQHIGVEHMGSALHWGPAWDVNRFYLTVGTQENQEENYADHWHTYEMEWSEERLITRVDGKDVLVVPSDEEKENWKGFWDFGMRNGGMDGRDNPWEGATTMAPFDQAFHLILNVAVGGTGGFIPDDVVNAGGARPKPWTNDMSQTDAKQAFWHDRDNWYPTWVGEESALRVKNIKVYQWGEVDPKPIPDSCSSAHATFVVVMLGIIAVCFM